MGRPLGFLVRVEQERETNNTLYNISHPRGRPRLLKAISKHYSPQFENLAKENRELRPEEIVVTAGANEGESEHAAWYYHDQRY